MNEKLISDFTEEEDKLHNLDNKELMKKIREDKLFSNEYNTLNESICASLVTILNYLV